MTRRDAIRAGAAMIAGLAMPSPLIASASDHKRHLLVLIDPAIDASRQFGSLLGDDGATAVMLERNRLVAWHRDIVPHLGEGRQIVVGLTHAADAQFFGDAGREAGLRQEAAWLHLRRASRFEHKALRTACDGRAVSCLDLAGERWIEQAALFAADRAADPAAIKRLMAASASDDVHDLVSWRMA